MRFRQTFVILPSFLTSENQKRSRVSTVDISITTPLASSDHFRQLFSPSDRSPWRRDSYVNAVASKPKASVGKLVRALQKSLPKLSKRQVEAWTQGALARIDAAGETASLEELSAALAERSAKSNGKAAANGAADDAVSAFGTSPSADDVRTMFSLLLCRGRDLKPQTFWEVWQTALSGFQRMVDELDPPEGSQGPADRQLMLSCELRWLAAAVNRDFVDSAGWIREARAALSRWLDELLDKNGIPDAAQYDRLADAVRSLGRCAVLAELLGEKPCKGRDRKWLRAFLKALLPLLTADGTLAGSNAALPWNDLARLADYVCNTSHSALRDRYRRLARIAQKGGAFAEKKIRPVPSSRPVFQSDSGHLAVLRASWAPESDACAVRHHAPEIDLWLQAGGAELLSGAWTFSGRADGKHLNLTSPWTCTCWFSDRDGDFIELQQDFGGGVKHERQLFLSRTDRFLLMTECLHAEDDAAELELTAEIPLVAGWKPKRDKASREWTLKRGRGRSVRSFPAWMPQELRHSSDGGFSVDAEKMLVQAEGHGALFVPLVLQWEPSLTRVPAQWRKLTVTEDRRRLADCDAAAYRVRTGPYQLLLYHSFRTPKFPRAALGMHTSSETVFAAVDADGDALPLLNVE